MDCVFAALLPGGRLGVTVAGPLPARVVHADHVRVDAARLREVDGEELAHDVDDWMARGDEGRLEVDLSQGRHEVVGSPAEAAAFN